MTRSEARCLSMNIIYQFLLYEKNNISYDVTKVLKEEANNDSFVSDIVNGVLDNRDKLFEIANKYLKDWKITRLSLPDQAILVIGIYEILYTDTPDVVAIDEAINLSKKYSDDKVKNIINGVLDKVLHEKS